MSSALIIADLEGIAGVEDLNDSERCRNLYNQEIEAVVRALKTSGFGQVVVCDAHNQGDMLDPIRFGEIGVMCVSQLWHIPFTYSYDVALLCGFHGMVGSSSRFPHSFRPEIKEVRVGNHSVGEVGVFCRWLGGLGIPVALVSGDSGAVEEARADNEYRLTFCMGGISKRVSSLRRELERSVREMAKTYFAKCLSSDEDCVSIEFFNEDIGHMLNAQKRASGNVVSYKNCRAFVDDMERFCGKVGNISRQVIETNSDFIIENKALFRGLAKEYAENSSIGALLSKDLLTLTQKNREEILSFITNLKAGEVKNENN